MVTVGIAFIEIEQSHNEVAVQRYLWVHYIGRIQKSWGDLCHRPRVPHDGILSFGLVEAGGSMKLSPNVSCDSNKDAKSRGVMEMAGKGTKDRQPKIN